MTKRFKLSGDEVRRLIPSMGGCIATDMITVEGKRVDYMARSDPHNPQDSGWMFMGGGETQAYMDDPANHGIYDLNTIANYDPEIIEFLTYPVGTEAERGTDGKLHVVGDVPKPEMTLLSSVTGGPVAMTRTWQTEVNELLLRRVDQGHLVLWRPGLTYWIAAFEGDTPSARTNMDALASGRSPSARDIESVEDRGMLKLRYRVDEAGADGAVQSSIQMIACYERGVISVSAYYDDDQAMHQAEAFFRALRASALG